MAITRQDDNSAPEQKEAPSITVAGADSTALLQSTLKIHKALKRRGSELLAQSFIFTSEAAPLFPPASLDKSELFFFHEHSENLKNSLGIKGSAHTVDVVQFLEGGCDLVYSLPLTNTEALNNLPGNGKACYVITADKKIYYADKILRKLTPLTINAKEFDTFLQKIVVKLPEKIEAGAFACLADNLSPEQLKYVTIYTKHLHGMGFYKHSPEEADSVMFPVEAANSTAYQLLGPRNFPTCYAVRKGADHFVGVLSKLLSGFKPNREKALQHTDLELSSLKNMIKKRDEHDMLKLNEIFSTIKEIVPLLKREVNPKNGFLSRAWAFTKNTHHYYLGDTNSAMHVKPVLEEFVKQNPPTITFGKLENIRQLLLKRKANLEAVKSSYVAEQHDHDTELPLLNKAIEQLNLILLDDIALFMKAMYRINKELEAAWVDVAAEKHNPKSKYAHIQITDGLLAPLNVSLDDILHYRIHKGQAIGLTSRYFLQDPDGHSRNISCDGLNVDGDLALYGLTYHFKNPGKRPRPDDYAFNVVDFIYFPNLTYAKYRYWPTQATMLDTSTDTALSQVSDLTKNYFTKDDNVNYQNLEKSPVFNFQKYVQLIIFSLTNSKMFAAIAKLHMSDNLHMLNSESNPPAPLPLLNSLGQRMDLQYKWVEACSQRAQEAKVNLAMQLAPVKMILSRHSDFVLELVLDHFQRFIDDRRNEFNADSLKLLEEAINPTTLTNAYQELIAEVLVPEQANLLPRTPNLPPRN